MAKIKKIQEQGRTIYPATITQAIKDGESGKGLDDIYAKITPSGDPMHYAYVEAGAVWNNTTGYWELNGLTDITTAQMRTIYVDSSWMRTSSIQAGCLAYSKARTNIVPRELYVVNGVIRLVLNNAFRACNAETIVLWNDEKTPTTAGVYVGDMQAAFYSCTKLKSIYGVFNLSMQQNASNLNYIFNGTTKLERVKIKGCKFNINLSMLSSLLVEYATYLVANASTTDQFSITFNANRQAIYETDTAFVEAKNAHTNITINYI